MRIRSFGALALLCAFIIPISANRATAQQPPSDPSSAYPHDLSPLVPKNANGGGFLRNLPPFIRLNGINRYRLAGVDD